MKKTKWNFIKLNPCISVLGIAATAFVIFYCVTYDLPELWHNAHVLVDVAFQLSLALIASLIFYIFQVYIPARQNRSAVWPLVEDKIKYICFLIETLFSNFAELYLNQSKKIDTFTDDDICNILKKYKYKDHIFSVTDHNQLFGEISKSCFNEVKKVIDDLLTFFSTRLSDKEIDALIQLKADKFYTLLSSPISKVTDMVGIPDASAYAEFKAFQHKYIKVKEIVECKEQANNGQAENGNP